MKSFKQYIFEEPELVSTIAKPDSGYLTDIDHPFYRMDTKNLGKIHKDYSLYTGRGDFFIVHDKTQKLVGHIQSNDTNYRKKQLTVWKVIMDLNHTKKKIGHSLPVKAYKHLHSKGYEIHSGEIQSIGGASIWRELMDDPKTKRYVNAVYDNYDTGETKDLGQASKLHTGDIWVSGSGELRRKAKTKGIGMNRYSGDHPAYSTRLILKRKTR